ncbi:MAG: KH domain-containing protein [Candidatus Gracilibacteria bacterium]|nr:KH domain-containing protein [Candidatus Gracilibacteria bacterium]
MKYIITNLVDDVEAIHIERTEDELGILLTLGVAKNDMGIIIGKGGNTINSIRTLLRIFGMKMEKRINLKVLD